MFFNEIKPFVRYVRYYSMDAAAPSSPVIPYDARLFYTCEGYGVIESGGRLYEMQEGSVLIINAGVEYCLHTPRESVRYLAVNFDYTYSNAGLSIPIRPVARDSFVRDDMVEHVTFDDVKTLNRVTYVGDMQVICRKLVKMEYQYSHRFKFFELEISSVLAGILITCVRHGDDAIRRSRGESAVKIIDYIHDNYMGQLTNREIGEEFGFHPNYVSSIVKECTGMPLHQYLMHLRILHAASLLEEKGMSVTEVAGQCGFRDIYYFSRYFKKKMGVSPTEYQNS